MRAELVGGSAVSRALEQLASRLSDLTPVWRALLADWKAQQKRVFETEGAAIGAHWPPLSPRYVEWKARHFGGQGTLVRSGHLRAAAEGHGSGYSEHIAALAVEFKITDPVAQYVSRRRPIARFSEVEKRRWLRLLQDFVGRSVATAGR